MADLKDVRGEYHFETFVRNRKTYKQAWGWLGMPYEVQTHRSVSAQKKAAGGTGDDAGHLIGNRFGSSGGAENLSLQNWKANRYGTYKDLEELWAAKRSKGVDIYVQVTDIIRFGEIRPFMRNVHWIERAGEKETPFEIDFANTHTPESRSKQHIPGTNPGGVEGEVIHVDFRLRQRIS